MSKLAILMVGLGGSVGSTVAAGLGLMRRGLSPRIGMLCETGTVKLAEDRRVLLRDHLGLPSLEDIVVGGWDIHDHSMLEATRAAGVLSDRAIDAVAAELAEIRPMAGVFSQDFVQ